MKTYTIYEITLDYIQHFSYNDNIKFWSVRSGSAGEVESPSLINKL